MMAEKEGFEPSIRFRIHTFQACAFDHSATSPEARKSSTERWRCDYCLDILSFDNGRGDKER